MTRWPRRSDQKRCYGQAEEEDGDYEPVNLALLGSDTGKIDGTYCTPALTGLARYIRASLMIMKYRNPAQEPMTTAYVTVVESAYISRRSRYIQHNGTISEDRFTRGAAFELGIFCPSLIPVIITGVDETVSSLPSPLFDACLMICTVVKGQDRPELSCLQVEPVGLLKWG